MFCFLYKKFDTCNSIICDDTSMTAGSTKVMQKACHHNIMQTVYDFKQRQPRVP